MTNDESTEDTADLQEIPEEVQDLTVEELNENICDIAPASRRSGDENDPRMVRGPDPAAIPEPGRTMYDDSIDASSKDPGGTRDGHDYSAGHEMTAATGVGKPDDPNYDEDLQRINDGRHWSDGSLSHRQSEWDKKRFTQAICSDLPISKRQREMVVLAMEKLDLDRFGHQKAIERVCLGVATVIVNDERVEQTDDPGDVTLLSWESEFQDLAKKYDVAMSDLSTIKETVRDELGDRPPVPSDAGIKRDLNLPKITPDEKPDEYWEVRHTQYWVMLARTWESRDNDIKEAIPNEKRELVDLLRKWKPWDRTDDPKPEPPDGSVEQGSDTGSSTDQNTDIVSELDELKATVEEEAEALVEQMEDDT